MVCKQMQNIGGGGDFTIPLNPSQDTSTGKKCLAYKSTQKGKVIATIINPNRHPEKQPTKLTKTIPFTPIHTTDIQELTIYLSLKETVPI